MRERLPALRVHAFENGQGRAKHGRQLSVARSQALKEVIDCRTVRKLKQEHRRRREPRDAAAKANPNLHEMNAPGPRAPSQTRSYVPTIGPVKVCGGETWPRTTRASTTIGAVKGMNVQTCATVPSGVPSAADAAM
jgi:hypothetical protein